MKPSDPEIGPNEYRCECCHEVFEKGRTDEDAKAEAVANGYDPDDDCGIVCDLCYHKHFSFLNVGGAAAMHEETRELLKAEAEDFPDEFLSAFRRALGWWPIKKEKEDA